MFMIYLHATFHSHSSSGSLETVSKPKPKESFCMAITSLFYITLKYYFPYFSKSYDQTPFQDHTMMLPPQKFMLAMLSLLTAGK